MLRAALIATSGDVSEAARHLRISRPFFWFCLRKFEMGKVPAHIRGLFKTRYRLPPLEDLPPSAP